MTYRRFRFLLAVFVATFGGGGFVAGAAAETRVALIIGNADYAHGGRLSNPPNDAAAVAQSLRQVGFQVISRSDLGKVALEEELKSFTRAASGADVALIYYAGHGIEKGGANYLIPVDATLAADSDVDFEAVPLDLVMHSVAGAGKLKIVILDACRNNPFRDTMRRSTGTRGIGQGLAKPPDPEEGDMLVAYAADAGSTAEDGGGANSPFAAALAQHLRDPGIDIRIMFGKVRDDVRAATQHRQEPAVYESLGGEQFIMAPGAGGTANLTVNATVTAPDSRAVDLAFWQSVEASNDIAQLKAYLGEFPKGAFTALARAKIEALSKASPVRVESGNTPRAAPGAAPADIGQFDGQWDVVQTCPASADGALGYRYEYLGDVRASHLHAEHGAVGHGGWISLEGTIQPDGAAKFDAHGITGQSRFAINHAAPGTEFHHLVNARFDGNRGAGQWVTTRVCTFDFTRE